jgi:hypothetical protein
VLFTLNGNNESTNSLVSGRIFDLLNNSLNGILFLVPTFIKVRGEVVPVPN